MKFLPLIIASVAAANTNGRALRADKNAKKTPVPVAAPVAAPVRAPTPFPVGLPPTAFPTGTPPVTAPITPVNPKCAKTEAQGADNSERLLLRNGVISSIPKSLCDAKREGQKNVILVIGDGMGWEMVRAGAIAKQVVAELKAMNVDIKAGATGDAATAAKAKFAGRRLSNYYTEGPGTGLSFQNLPGFALSTTTTTVLQAPEDGFHYAPATSLLAGDVATHDDGMAPLALNECGEPINFNTLDYESTNGVGNMVLWDEKKGGKYPWDARYYQTNPDTSTGFDKEYIMRHATDSANTAGTMATGTKASVNMMSLDLYEEQVSTIIEDAMMCGKSGGVVSSVPVLHATPGAFITHSNNRNNGPQMQRNMRALNPTYVSGTCSGINAPSEAHKLEMINGSMSNQWTFLNQKKGVSAANFYDPIQNLDPDDDKHVFVCLAGSYTASKRSNLPYRGVDSSYDDRWCSSGRTIVDPATNVTVRVNVTTPDQLCDYYSPEEIAEIPHIKTNVMEAINFLSKDKDGFFLMYEQGDIDWAAHANHMDDMLGTMFDIDESVGAIIDWVGKNGGWEKNALYVTADHDHYLTLSDHFPEALANLIIEGRSYDITPKNNSQVNPWDVGIRAGRHKDPSKSVTDHIADFATWSKKDIEMVAHFWGSRGSGGNGWGSHSTRPVPVYYAGDNGCIEKLTGKGYRVLGKDVAGSPGNIDQMHIHACMMENLFGL